MVALGLHDGLVSNAWKKFSSFEVIPATEFPRALYGPIAARHSLQLLMLSQIERRGHWAIVEVAVNADAVTVTVGVDTVVVSAALVGGVVVCPVTATTTAAMHTKAI
jgi:hypothetical protein